MILLKGHHPNTKDSELQSCSRISEDCSKVFQYTKQEKKKPTLISCLLFLPIDDLTHPKADPPPFTESQFIAQITSNFCTASALLICVPPATIRKFHC